jgi:hypothetical protein
MDGKYIVQLFGTAFYIFCPPGGNMVNVLECRVCGGLDQDGGRVVLLFYFV